MRGREEWTRYTVIFEGGEWELLGRGKKGREGGGERGEAKGKINTEVNGCLLILVGDFILFVPPSGA